MSDGLFGRIIGGGLGSIGDARALSMDEVIRRNSDGMWQAATPSPAELAFRMEASRNVVPVYFGPPERPQRVSLRSRLTRWLFGR